MSADVKNAEMWFEKVLQVVEDSAKREEAEEGLAELRSDPKQWSQQRGNATKTKTVTKTIINTDDWMSNGDRHFEAQNYDEAVRCYRKAEKQGYIDAKAMLGFCYLCGLGVSQNDEYGAQLLEEAADEGSEKALELIEVYKKDYGEVYKAPTITSPAAANSYGGNNDYTQGNIYYNQGLYAKAIEYYSNAASQGDNQALWILGVMYMNGTGVEKNIIYGIKLINEAAAVGNQEAQKWLQEYKDELAAGFTKVLKFGSTALKIIGVVTENPTLGIAATTVEKFGTNAVNGDYSAAWTSAKEGFNKLLQDDEEENEEDE